MNAQITITSAMRLRFWAHLTGELERLEPEKAPCHEPYPSCRILSKIDLRVLIPLMKPMFAEALQRESAAVLLTREAAFQIEKHAWNEYNAYLLLRGAIERAWRFPLTEGDVRRALARLRDRCPDQPLLGTVLSGDFKSISATDMDRAKQLGIVIDGLWCPWMESWEVVNPVYLPAM